MTRLFFLIFTIFFLNSTFANSILLTQSGQDEPADYNIDAYDPFTDYSDFEGDAEEEEDIHFFRHGRFFEIGIATGYKYFTRRLGQAWQPNVPIGFFLSYFFNLKLALHISYVYSNHEFDLRGSPIPENGNISSNDFTLGVKYFFNTQNMTRGLAPLNPYITINFLQFWRTFSLPSSISTNTENATGVSMGAGIEFPVSRSLFLGFEGTYKYFSIEDEIEPIRLETGPTGLLLPGDAITLLGFIGTSF